MRSWRIYVDEALAEGRLVTLREERAHYASRVLRLRTGDPVTVFNGEGGEYHGAVREINKKTVTIETHVWHDYERESPLDVTLIQAVAAQEKMDFILQKAVELGVRGVIPVASARARVRLDPERAAKRLRHWRAIVVSACEQCGRNRLPEVHAVTDLDHCFASLAESSERWLLSPEAGAGLRGRRLPEVPVYLLVGPEGGFSPEERQRAKDHGFQPLRLGPRVLRTETAALAALAAMQTLWGDFQ